MQLFFYFFLQLVCLRLLLLGTPLGEDKTVSEYQKQQEKLSHETNPIGKAKILTRMSDLDLAEATHWAKKGNLAEADRFLDRYSDIIRQIDQALRTSKRDAQKNPAGFKEFEISLRRQLRKLADLKLSYSFDQRERINEAIATAESAKEDMFQALFGPENTGRRKDAAGKPPKEASR
jgi:hypothetical protein